MRHFVYFSSKAATSGKALSQGDLMKAGRMDIAIHSLIQGIFLSHDFRKDVKFHFVFYGQPDPPKHIEVQIKDDTPISKKDVGEIIKKLLYKYKEGKKTEVFPGCFVEKKSLMKVVEELKDLGSEIFILDRKGEKLKDTEVKENPVFILGDHEGLPQKELKALKKIATPISVGLHTYFASQVIAYVNVELDNRD